MNLRDEGFMARALRDCGDTCEATLRAIIETLMQPTAVMVSAGWRAVEDQHGRTPVPPVITYRAMLQAALDELVDPMKQHADTDGTAKLHDTIERHVSERMRKIQF